MRRIGLALAIIALAIALAGCSAPTARARTEGKGWVAELEWSPQRPRALQPVHLVLKVLDSSGRAREVQDLQARADMPDMAHEPDRLVFRRSREGTYETTHKFSMDGRWRIQVTGHWAEGRVDARFELVVGGP